MRSEHGDALCECTLEYSWAPHSALLDEHIDRLCVTSQTTNYNRGVQEQEGLLSPLDDARLNKGPPTNTNTGSRLLSLAASFVLSDAQKAKHGLNPEVTWQRSAGSNVTGVWRFTLWWFLDEH